MNNFVDPFSDVVWDKYLRDIQTWHGYIRFVGLPVLKDTGRVVPLPQLFVEPRLSGIPLSPDQVNDGKGGDTVSLSQVIIAEPKVVLLGDPGSGKSTIVSWLCSKFSSFSGSTFSSSLGYLIPIPLILRELNLQDELNWITLIESFLSRSGNDMVPQFREKLDSILLHGQAIILIDGLDEVSPEQRFHVRKAVWEGWEKYPLCRWVMTSRVIGYDQCPFDLTPTAISNEDTKDCFAGRFDKEDRRELATIINVERAASVRLAPRYYVSPFGSSQIREFSFNWHRLRASSLKEAEENSNDFWRAISGDPGTQALARVPNLLTLMVLIHRQHATLPNGRALLFSKIAEAYLESIDESRKLRPVIESTRAEKERWLADVAFEMQLQRYRRITENRRKREKEDRQSVGEIRVGEKWLIKHLTRFLMDRKEASLEQANHEAESLLRAIAERSGLLLPRGAEGGDTVWSFAHLSFQEYFAAQRLRRAIRSPRWSNDPSNPISSSSIKSYASNEIWRDTLILLFESLAEEDVDDASWPDELIKIILPAADAIKVSSIDFEVARLSGGLFSDPHSGLSLKARRAVADTLWGMIFGDRGSFWWNSTSVINDLLVKKSFSSLGMSAMNIAIKKVKPRAFHVSELDASALSVVISSNEWTELIILNCDITQEHVELIAATTSLGRMVMSYSRKLDFSSWSRLEQLRDLSLYDANDDFMLSELVRNVPWIVEFAVDRIDQKIAAAIAREVPDLKHLSIYGAIDNESLIAVSELRRIDHLTVMILSSQMDMEIIRNRFPHLRRLEFWRAPDDGWPNFEMLVGMDGLVVEVGAISWDVSKEPLPPDFQNY